MTGTLTLQGKLLAAAILVILVVGGSALIGRSIFDNGFKDGVASSEATHQAALAKVNEANAKTTQKLEADLADAGRRYDDLAARRRDREQVIVREVEQALVDAPNCQITPEVLALRNAIRNQ